MIEAKNLKKKYSPKKGVEVRALDDVSLRLPDTGMVFVLGKSGSGKSTLLNVLGGLDTIDSGEIFIKGQSSKEFRQSHFDSYRNTYVGFIFQEYNILEEFTVGANIALAIELQGRKATNEEINSILEEVDLKGLGGRKPNELSGGQKQRVAIAGLMALEPACIVLDEPTAMLDPQGRKEIVSTVKSLNKDKGITIVYITHYMTEALAADRVVVMEKGHIRFMGTPKEVFSRVDELEKIGLEAPLAAKVASELRKSGIKLAKDIITDEELAQALCQ